VADPSLRNCYCRDPDPLATCGDCDRCGRPGHVRHAPNGMPYTAAFCDRCYRIVRFTQPLILWIPAYGLLVLLIFMAIEVLIR